MGELLATPFVILQLRVQVMPRHHSSKGAILMARHHSSKGAILMARCLAGCVSAPGALFQSSLLAAQAGQ
jgi:hypothetical protein